MINTQSQEIESAQLNLIRVPAQSVRSTHNFALKYYRSDYANNHYFAYKTFNEYQQVKDFSQNNAVLENQPIYLRC